MAQRPTAIFADQIDDSALGDGLQKNISDNSTMEVDIKANNGLIFDIGELTISYDDATIGIISNELAIKDDGIGEIKLTINNLPTDGYVLTWNQPVGKMEWADIDANAVLDNDVICNEIPSGLINSINTIFTLANAPVLGTVQVFLNGLFQAPGSALDYTISGSTITFNKAPHTNSDLYVNYIIA